MLANFNSSSLELQQVQQLSVLQMQYLRLLQMNTLELNTYLNEMQLENPLIDVVPPDTFISDSAPSAMELAGWSISSSRAAGRPDPNEDDSPSIGDFTADDRSLYSLEEYLKSQIDISIDGKEYHMIDHLIGFLDINGYLAITAEQLALDFSCDISLANEAIGYLQTLDPSGIGARNLSECLQIQLLRMGISDDDAMRLCDEPVLVDLAHGHFQKVSRALGISVDRVTSLYSIIRTLNPRPASAFGPETTVVMIPDVTILEDNGKLGCRFNKQYSASISVNRDYLSLGSSDIATKEYLNRKMSQALWIVNAVQSRQETIERIVSVIVSVQRDFFKREGGTLRPLKLSDVASEIGARAQAGDGVGNRISATLYGPKRVVFVVGRNKLTPDLPSAMERAQKTAGPPNAKRLNKKTPCAVTGVCANCKSPDRICGAMTIHMKPLNGFETPEEIILINEDLGY